MSVYVTPSNVLVSYEGEVRMRGFGYAPSRIREAGLIVALAVIVFVVALVVIATVATLSEK